MKIKIKDNGEQIEDTSQNRLFQLYVARVATVDLVHTVRTNKRKVFEESYDEAKIAEEVFVSKQEGTKK